MTCLRIGVSKISFRKERELCWYLRECRMWIEEGEWTCWEGQHRGSGIGTDKPLSPLPALAFSLPLPQLPPNLLFISLSLTIELNVKNKTNKSAQLKTRKMKPWNTVI